MSNKNWKKIIAVFTAAVIALAGVPWLPFSASADGEEDAAAGTETAESVGEEGADGEGGEQQEAQQVGEDGEVVQDGAVGKIEKSKWITKDKYEVVMENESYKMYLYQPRLSILLEDKKTGKIIESTLSDEKDDGNSNASWNALMKSGIVINAIVGTKNNYQVDMILSQNTINVTKNDKGFSADLKFPEYGFSLTVNVTLEGDNLIVNIPDDSIKEEKENNYISNITLFPFMGYSFLDEKPGYMLIPDGNGALIYLDNKEGRYNMGFSQMIYGSDAGFTEPDTKSYLWEEIDMLTDANEIIAPVFGIVHTEEETGYLAVVEKGEKRANIVVEPNGVSVNYNRCYARFLLRDVFVQPLNNSNSGTMQKVENDRTHSDLQVRYLLLSKDEADYSTMASKYRQYLLDNQLVAQKDNSYRTRVDILGTDRENFLLGTRAVTMTRTEDATEIYNDLQSAGVLSLLSVYKGWQDGGLYNVPISEYDADSSIGGTSEVTKLVKASATKDFDVYLYADALRMNPSNHTFNFDTIKKVNKRSYEEEVWAEVYKKFNYLVPKASAEDFTSFAQDASANGVNNIAVAGISNTLFSYSLKGDFYTRNDTAKAYGDLLDGNKERMSFALERPCAYLWNNCSAFLDMPLGSSDYIYVDEEIPFLSMVLKGVVPMYSDYVNFEANKQEFFLQMIESGVFPSFYVTKEDSSNLIYTNSADLYSTAYSTYKDMIKQYDKDFRKFGQDTKDANIIKHEKLDSGVTRVTYSNGVKVYVNYTDTVQTVDGITIGAMSYSSNKAGETENE